MDCLVTIIERRRELTQFFNYTGDRLDTPSNGDVLCGTSSTKKTCSRKMIGILKQGTS